MATKKLTAKQMDMVAELEQCIGGVTFPSAKVEQPFDTFTRGLTKLVEARFGDSIARRMDYDKYTQEYYWQCEESAYIRDSMRDKCHPLGHATYHRTFSFDPRKGVAAELDRVATEMLQWRAAVRAANRALYNMEIEDRDYE